MNERDIFLEALKRDSPDQRSEYLDAACAGDPALRRRIEELLKSHEAGSEFLLKLAPQRLAEMLAAGETAEATEDGFSSDGQERDDVSFLTPTDEPGLLGVLSHYDIQEVIGRGGMGIVLRAFDERLHRIVAIKVLTGQLATSASARKRFTREAQAQAAVCHEHVVTIHAVDEANGRPYLVMQFVAGMSLEERLQRGGPLTLHEILRIGMQTASGLTAAHAQGLIHRDIKPANILLENGVERVKITDFGLARAAADASLTQTGAVAGTPHYMAPEQSRGEALDARTDLFSLGSVLYAMCTGRSPFRAASSMAVLKRVCEDTPTPIREINPEIPAWLVAIIENLHAKDPAERFQSAAEVAELLGLHLAHVQHPSVVGQTFRSAAPAPSKTRMSAPRRRFVIAAAALLVCLFAGFSLTEATGVTNVRATVIRIFTPDGVLVVETDDPTVKVTVEGDGGLIITDAGPQEVRVRPGMYTVRASKNGKPLYPDRELVSITRGDRQVVRVRLEPVSQAPPMRAVDLLRLIDVDRDAVEGKWRFDGETLVSPGTGRWDRINIPFNTPEEYDLAVTAERKGGADMLGLDLVSGARQFFVALDMFEGRLSGLGLIDGKDAFANETTREQAVFKDRLPHKIVCRVRRTGIQVDVDGKSWIDWQGDLDRLSRPKSGETGLLGITVSHSTYHIYDLILRPVSLDLAYPEHDAAAIEDDIRKLTERIERSPGDQRARIDRAHLYVRQRRWRDGADDLSAAGEATLQNPGDAFLYAILLVHLREIRSPPAPERANARAFCGDGRRVDGQLPGEILSAATGRRRSGEAAFGPSERLSRIRNKRAAVAVEGSESSPCLPLRPT